VKSLQRKRLKMLRRTCYSLHAGSEALQSTRVGKQRQQSVRKEASVIPTATIRTLSQKGENKSHPTDKHHEDNRTLNQGKGCPPKATHATPKPWQATALSRCPPRLRGPRAVYITLTLHESHGQESCSHKLVLILHPFQLTGFSPRAMSEVT
jgi:hypothetical protein